MSCLGNAILHQPAADDLLGRVYEDRHQVCTIGGGNLPCDRSLVASEVPGSIYDTSPSGEVPSDPLVSFCIDLHPVVLTQLRVFDRRTEKLALRVVHIDAVTGERV